MARCPILVGTLVTSMLVTAASAQPFYRIFHSTETQLPGAPVEQFDGVDRDGTSLYFRVFGTDGSLEILRHDSTGFSLVASTSTPIPGVGAVDYVLREPSAANGAVVMEGLSADSSISAILLEDASGWHQVVNGTTIDPLTGAPFMVGSSPVSYDGERILFPGHGIYELRDGQISVMAAPNQPLPGTSITPASLGGIITPRLNAGAAYFTAGASDTSSTIWKGIAGTTTAVLAAGDPTPSGAVEYVLSYAAHGDDVLVLAYCHYLPGHPIEAVLLVRPTGVTTVIDESMLLNGQHVFLGYFNYGLALDDQIMSFNGDLNAGGGTQGFLTVLFAANPDGSNLHVVIRAGDTLDGRTVGTVRVYPESAQNGEIIFAVKFTDGTSGLYSTVPVITCGSADFNHDGDTGTDSDINDFFACLAGNCCPTCGSADFNGDGDTGTDADIESFFRVLAGGAC